MELTYDEAIFTELLLHVAFGLQEDRAEGASKLNEVIFIAEFTHLRRHHTVISGCEFQRLAHGPVPRQLVDVQNRLLVAGEAKLVDEDFLGQPQHHLLPLRAVDASVFTAEQLETVDDVVGKLAKVTAAEVSELSHQEPGWQLTEVGETIPFSTAFLDFPQVPTPTSERVSRDVAQRYGFAIAP